MLFLKELGNNRLYPIFIQIFYVVLIFVTVVAGGWFLIGKIQAVNGLLATETENYQTASEKLNYLNTFPYDTGVLLQKVAYVLPSTEASFVALSSLKAKLAGDVMLNELTLGDDQKGSTVLSVEIAGSSTSVLSFVSSVLEGYPVCDLSNLEFDAGSGMYNLNLNFYHQNTPDETGAPFAKLTSNEETLLEQVLGVSVSGGSGVSAPSSYSRDNPF